MTYIRNPRHSFLWESDGEYTGKFRADDGTLHDEANDVLKYERERDAKRASESEQSKPPKKKRT